MSAGSGCMKMVSWPLAVLAMSSVVEHQSLWVAFWASSSFSRAAMPASSPSAYRLVRFSMAA